MSIQYENKLHFFFQICLMELYGIIKVGFLIYDQYDMAYTKRSIDLFFREFFSINKIPILVIYILLEYYNK